MTSPNGVRAAIYTRISQDREGEALGVARQRDDCKALAERLGYEVVRVYEDNDKGASTRSRKRRPEYEEMISDARAGKVQAILSYSNSRLTRRPREVEDLIELHERHGIRLHTVVSGDDNLSTADGRMVARIKGNVDAAEAERIGERVARSQQSKRDNGEWTGGPRPFGYEAGGVTVRDAEADAIRLAYRQVALGASLASITRAWNDAGLRTGRSNGEWTVAGVREALKNPRYAGLRAYRGEVVGAAAWSAIVPEEEWLAVRAILTDPSRAHGPKSGQRLLTGVATCGAMVDGRVCGGPVHGAGSSADKPVYRCVNGGHFVRAAGPIDRHVEATVLARLTRPDARELLMKSKTGPNVNVLRAERDAVNGRLEALMPLAMDGTLTPAQVKAMTEQGKARIAAIDAELADAGRVNILGPLIDADDPERVWWGMGNDGQRAVVDLLCDVVILPAGRGTKVFSVASVVVTPKNPGASA